MILIVKRMRAPLRSKLIDTPFIAITGGKGGTGKSTVAVNISVALSARERSILLIDGDVDNPSDVSLMGLKLINGESVHTMIPKIDENRCVKCGKCSEVCESHALIQVRDKFPILYEELCSGCGACMFACPTNAISEGRKMVGSIYFNEFGKIRIITGVLKTTEPRSLMVIKAVKEKAFKVAKRSKPDLMIIDTPPGTQITVAQALKGVDYAVAVTEPTPLGLHDLKMLFKLTRILDIPTGVVINRSDLSDRGRRSIRQLCQENSARVLAEIPFDEEIMKSCILGKPVVLYSRSPGSRSLLALSERIYEISRCLIQDHDF